MEQPLRSQVASLAQACELQTNGPAPAYFPHASFPHGPQEYAMKEFAFLVLGMVIGGVIATKAAEGKNLERELDRERAHRAT